MSRNRLQYSAFLGGVFFFLCAQGGNALLGKPLLCNPGIGFGIPIPQKFLLLSTLLGILMIASFLRIGIRDSSSWYKMRAVAIALLGGGAASNFLDRLRWGCVPDFFPLFFFPAFNIADVGISLGAVLLLFTLFCAETNTKNQK
ncbi:MAG: signal peptidase II [Candidatus Moraniibacteriota bacterium]|nr:MAG: signal peptidase II [Candidatus Moranbacteria bacterium]